MSIIPKKLHEVALPISLAVAILYFAQDFLIPLALAILISFLLAPLARRFERIHFGRVSAVLTSAFIGFAILGSITVVVGGQLIDLANRLPDYRSNLHDRVASLKLGQQGSLARAAETLKELTAEVSKPEPVAADFIGPQRPNDGKLPPGTPAIMAPPPLPVAVVSGSGNAFESLKSYLAPLVKPLGTAAIVIIFVIFILLEREDLRDRVIHLIGRGHLQVTTQALNEAGKRVSKYLLAQCVVNVTYGIPIGVGLALIGIPNALLWGLLATVLRFIPYIGPWIAASFPILLSLAVSTSWSVPLMVIGLFVVLELISNNVVEPWLYGSSTGLSPIAIIVSATFWTWLWGSIGLLLATPLTVCFLVLGKYIPQLRYLEVLLGDRPPISKKDRFYQRLLARDEDEVYSIAEGYRAEHSLAETFDRLLVPAMLLADEDFHAGALPEGVRNEVYELVRHIMEDLADDAPGNVQQMERDQPAPVAVCIPASDHADEIIGLMLAKLLAQSGSRLEVTSSKCLASEMTTVVEQFPTRLLCVSVLPPGSTRHALYVVKRLRERFPEARILVGMWGEHPEDDHRLKRFRSEKLDGLMTTLHDMQKDILATGRVMPQAELEERTQSAAVSAPAS